MTIGKKQVTFRWGNYTKPTPKNVERLAGALRDTLAGIVALSVYSEFNQWVSIAISIGIIVVGQIAKFAAAVAQDQESATAEFPSGDTVTLTKDQPPEA